MELAESLPTLAAGDQATAVLAGSCQPFSVPPPQIPSPCIIAGVGKGVYSLETGAAAESRLGCWPDAGKEREARGGHTWAPQLLPQPVLRLHVLLYRTDNEPQDHLDGEIQKASLPGTPPLVFD